MSLYYLINSVLSTSDDLLTLSLYNTLHGRNYFPYFTDEETELKEPKEHSQDHHISKEQSQNSTWSGQSTRSSTSAFQGNLGLHKPP